MICSKCNKENRLGSKFCRYCGNTLENDSKIKTLATKITWKNPIALMLIGLILAGGLFYGGSKVYAYYQVQSKISSAKRFQSTGDFNGSLSILNNLVGYSPTAGQQNNIDAIKTNDQKFLTFKTSFDAAVALGNSSSTVNLQTALKDLQSIDTSYPIYKDVQTEIVKVQNSLVATLQNDAGISKKATAEAQAQAENNRQAAISAQAASDQANQNAQRAQSEAAQAAANAKAQADQAQTLAVEKSFVNQLRNILNNYSNNCLTDATNMIKNYNSGQDYSVYAGAAISSCDGVLADAKNLNNSFTNLPSDYVSAGNAMQWSAYYISQSISDFIAKDFTQGSSDANSSTPYVNQVDTFLQGH